MDVSVILIFMVFVITQRASSISYGFGDKLNRKKEPTKTEFQNLIFLIFHPILMHFLGGKMTIFMGFWWTIKKFIFFFKEESRMGANFEILHIWKPYLILEIINQDKCPKYNGSSILLCHNTLLCLAIYCVKQNSVSTLSFNIHLLFLTITLCFRKKYLNDIFCLFWIIINFSLFFFQIEWTVWPSHE
jgi:hypothetical protein